MTSSKPITPIRRSNSRPGSGSNDVPLTSSLELLTPHGGGAHASAGELRASKSSIPLSRTPSANEDGRRSTQLKLLTATRQSDHQPLLPMIPIPGYNASSSLLASSSSSSLLPSALPGVMQQPHSTSSYFPPPSARDSSGLPSYLARAPSPSKPTSLTLTPSAAPTTAGMQRPKPDSPPVVPPPLPPLDIDKQTAAPPATAAATATASPPPLPHHAAESQQSIDMRASSQSAFSALLDYGESADLTISARASSSTPLGGRGGDASVRASRDSVASGRAEAGGTFFTGLRRSFQHDEVDSNASGGDEQSLRGMESMMSSNAAPLESPSGSVEGETEGEMEADEGMDEETAEYMATYDEAVDGLSEYLNPMMTPREAPSGSEANTDREDVARTSLRSMFKDLYGSGDKRPTSSSSAAPLQEEGSVRSSLAAAAPEEGEEGCQEAEPATTDPTPSPEPEPRGEAGGDGDVEDGEPDAESAFLTEVKESMLRMEGILSAQEKRRNELGDYIQHLQTQVGEDGQALIEMPKNYLAMVEGLIRKQRGEYATLQGWLGPRRFEDLPINNLPDDHEDPKVTEGLNAIKELDGRLNDRTIEAMIVSRETFPEKYAEEESKRMQRHQKHVEETLKKQRMLHLRAAQLNRVVDSLDGVDLRASTTGSVAGSVAGSQAGEVAYTSKLSRFFQLRPEEEKLVEAVLARGEDAEEENNPFDISLSMASALLDATRVFAGGAEAAQAALSAHREPQEAHEGGSGAGAEAEDPGTPAAPSCTTDQDAPSVPSTPGAAAGTRGALSLRVSINAAAIASHAGVQEAAAAVSGLPLSVINARLEEYSVDHVWDQDGVLADYSEVSRAGAAGLCAEPRSKGGSAMSVAGSVAPYKPGMQAPSPGGARSEARSVGTSSMTANGKRDYLREEREAKELKMKEEELDARIRAFKTESYPARLDASTLAALVAEARKMEVLREQRMASSQPGTPCASTPGAKSVGCVSTSGRSEAARPLKPGVQRTRPTMSAGPGGHSLAGARGKGSGATPARTTSATLGAELFVGQRSGTSNNSPGTGLRHQSRGP